MPKRLLVAATTAALALTATPAHAALNGITPISPKQGDSVPAGKRPTFKMNVRGEGQVWVQVCDSRKKAKDGRICSGGPSGERGTLGQARRKGGSRYQFKAKFFQFPAFWLNNPGTYYWQAHRISCENGTDDCRLEGPIVKFKVR